MPSTVHVMLLVVLMIENFIEKKLLPYIYLKLKKIPLKYCPQKFSSKKNKDKNI